MLFSKLNSKIFFFPLEKESKFKKYYLSKHIKHNRIGLLIGILIYALFGILDVVIGSEIKNQLLIIRFFIILPIISFCLLLTFSSKFVRYTQQLIYIATVTSCIGIIMMMEIAIPPVSYLYYAGIILVLMGVYTLMRLRFLWASLAGFTVVIIYEIASLSIFNESQVILISNNFFFITSNLVGMAASYTIEYYIRNEYKNSETLKLESEKVAQANSLLENRVEERTKDLKKSNKKLKEAKELAEKSEKLKTEFLAQISHEIRTPINTILNFASLYKEEYGIISKEEADEYYSAINNAGKRMIRTIDLILNMSEIQIQSYKYKSTKFNIGTHVLKKIVQEHKFAASSKNLNLVYINNIDDLNIIADEYTIYQIFDNLLDNAIKYTEAGNVEIIVIQTTDGNIKVDVKDTGIGIAAEYIPTIFEPFTQEDSGYIRKYDGNGLGLALVKSYCELNNTEITVKSKKNSGTTFSVIIPKSNN